MGTANHILALDQGTTSSRAIVFDQFANERSVARQPTTQIYPHPGWVNQDAAEIWTTTLETARGALQHAGLIGNEIAGIGIVNQRETLVVWDRETSTARLPQSSGRAARASHRSRRFWTEVWARLTKQDGAGPGRLFHGVETVLAPRGPTRPATARAEAETSSPAQSTPGCSGISPEARSTPPTSQRLANDALRHSDSRLVS